MPSNYRPLGNSGLKVSSLCLGAMNFGNDRFGCDEASSLDIIAAYLDAGHNFIDTAETYAGGRSETIVGKGVRGRRDQVVIATKVGRPSGAGPFEGGTSRKVVLNAIEGSLRRLGTDYIDLYQMHRYDYETPLEETLSTLHDLVRQGKVRYIGVSNWTAAQIAEAACLTRYRGWEPVISLQPHYSVLTRDIEFEIIPTCLRFGLGIIPWSPLAGGMLTGKYKRGESPGRDTRYGSRTPLGDVLRPFEDRKFEIVDLIVEEAARLGTSPAALSLAWNLNRPGITSPIIGPKTLKQLGENLAALTLQIPSETAQRIDAASQPQGIYPYNLRSAPIIAPEQPR